MAVIIKRLMCIKLCVVEDTRYEHIYLKGGGHRVADRAKNADQKDTLAQ